MRIPLSWVSLFTPLAELLEKHPIRHLAHIYSTHTAEIDAIEEYRIDKVVIAKVLSTEKHPDSKKLSIVRVDQGPFGEETILTGAPNIVEAKYVPVAMVGAILPGDFMISERPMAGMMSRGMICGADEIGLAKESDGGILILESIWDESLLESKLGTSVYDLTLPFPGKNGSPFFYPLGEPMFEIDNKFITNRPDLFSVLGNAREFHAVFDTPTILTGEDRQKGIEENTSLTKNLKTLPTKVETKNCLSYHLLEMSDVKVEKSPFGIKLMMERADLSVKMDLVDITNLIMTELGQPMHVFDGDKIQGKITVRQARNGETLLALNGTPYELTPLDMVIADDAGPVALAGVIGGMESAVSESTTHILWESACFDATAVRLTAQRHGIRTDASTRYEKSLDPTLAGTTFSRIKEYLDFLGKSYTMTGYSSYLDAKSVNHIIIEVDIDFLIMKAGVNIPKSQILAILHRLGFRVSEHTERNNTLVIDVPAWRSSKDINIKEDIAEEVARIFGYDKTPLTPLNSSFIIGKRNADANLRNTVLSHFSLHSWNEVYTYSFTSEKLQADILSSCADAIGIVNAFNEEYTHMRTSLAPRLLMAAGENLKHSKNISFFEIGKVYSNSFENTSALLAGLEKKPFSETKKIAGISTSRSLETLRNDIEGLLHKTLSYVPPVHTGTKLSFLHPNASGTYREDDTIIAEFGKIHPAVASNFGIPEAYYFEIDFETLLNHREMSDVRFQPISRYQTIPRELNFVMDEHTPTGDVARTLDALHPWVREVTVDSIFIDEEKVGAGKKSVNFAFILSNFEDTISDDDAKKVQNLLIEEMEQRGFQLRK